MRVACIGLLPYPTRFWASALIAKPQVLMADNITPSTKAPPYRYCSGTTSSKETQESKAMKNRKAKRLFYSDLCVWWSWLLATIR
ncbi:hypothetical protein HTZ85_26410 [Escherichia coli]|nr:hypothetical protein [Escherichia coli]